MSSPLDFNHDDKTQLMEYHYANGDYSGGGPGQPQVGCGQALRVFFGVALAFAGFCCVRYYGDFGSWLTLVAGVGLLVWAWVARRK
ncbi:MAG: hypothetical protein Q4E12_06320 [Coriobacteriia bacterium]|nr:hypothetical protein [Coriobacteriia bacterium]